MTNEGASPLLVLELECQDDVMTLRNGKLAKNVRLNLHLLADESSYNRRKENLL